MPSRRTRLVVVLAFAGCAADPADGVAERAPRALSVVGSTTGSPGEVPSDAQSAGPSGSAVWSARGRRNSPRQDPTVGDLCATDADCAWEDPCMPDRCVGVHEAVQGAVCDESMKPTGRCLCVDKQCSLAPDSALTDRNSRVAGQSPYCEETECTLDRSRGSCAGATPSSPPNLRSRRSVQEGPGCVCESAKAGGKDGKDVCRTFWVEPVPCKSDLDCWVEHEPFGHPVARPPNKRAPFKPCSDGTVRPVCSEQGFCRLGSAYKC